METEIRNKGRSILGHSIQRRSILGRSIQRRSMLGRSIQGNPSAQIPENQHRGAWGLPWIGHFSAAGLGLAFALSLILPGLTTAHASSPLVEPTWLAEHLEDAQVVVLDIRNKIDGGSQKVYRQGHIPGAVYSNYLKDGWRREVNGVVGMLPPKAELEQLIGKLGISNDNHVVIVHGGVSSTDFGSAARVYWTFRVLGHDQVSILDGGWRAWTAEYPERTQSGLVQAKPARFRASAQLNEQLITHANGVERGVEQGSSVFVDARTTEQYLGEAKHPKAHAAGRVPKAIHLENTVFVSAETGKMLPAEEIRELARQAKIPENAEIVSYCNTGHWAAVAWFGLSEVAGYKNVRMYDGSMVEWTQDAQHPLIVGRDSRWERIKRSWRYWSGS